MRSLIDLERYPIDRPGSPELEALVERARGARRLLAHTGLAHTGLGGGLSAPHQPSS